MNRSPHPRVLPALWISLALLCSGCGGSGLKYTIKPSNLKEMSRQGQLWIYEAENEIIVSLDKLDEARDNLGEIRRRLRRAQKGLNRAEESKKPMLEEVAQAWVEHLKALEDWAEDYIELQEFGVVVARATVELAKAQVFNREDLLGGKDFSVKNYQAQYDELKQEYEKQRRQVEQQRKTARNREKNGGPYATASWPKQGILIVAFGLIKRVNHGRKRLGARLSLRVDRELGRSLGRPQSQPKEDTNHCASRRPSAPRSGPGPTSWALLLVAIGIGLAAPPRRPRARPAAKN